MSKLALGSIDGDAYSGSCGVQSVSVGTRGCMALPKSDNNRGGARQRRQGPEDVRPCSGVRKPDGWRTKGEMEQERFEVEKLK